MTGWEFDSKRIAKTIEYIKRFNLHSGFVVDIGDLQNPVSKIIWRSFPDTTPHGTDNDLRTTPLTFTDSSVDALICLEVIEHLSDQPYAHATTLNSVFFFLEEMYRVLKINGRALITTPNAASLWTIQRALLGQPPMMYEWHFREFTVDEISKIVESVGFKILHASTEYVSYQWNFDPIKRFMANNGYSLDNRGDDIFLVIQKPEKRERKPNYLKYRVKESSSFTLEIHKSKGSQ